MDSISVIIPTWNRAQLLPRAIDSVLSQSLPAKEIIVVDDGSTDETVQLLEQNYPQVKLIRQQQKGVSAARNNGILAANGDWLAFLDSDDAWHVQKLEKQVANLHANPTYKVIHNNEDWIRNGKPLQQLAKHRKSGGWIFQYCLPLCVISPSAVMIHQEVFHETGLFDENLIVCEDYDMWLRICSRMPVLYIDEPLTVKYGGHPDQLSRQYKGMDKYRIMALAKILNQDILDKKNRALAITELRHKINIYLNGAKKHNNNDYVAECEELLQEFK